MLFSKEIQVFLRKCSNNSMTTTLKLSSNQNKYRNFYTTAIRDGRVAFKLADIGEGIREVAVKEWFVKVGDKVSQFDEICEVQSDKASVTITSRYDGVIQKLYYKIDDVALVGQPLVDIETESDEKNTCEKVANQINQVDEKITSTSSVPVTDTDVSTQNADIICIPSVRRLAKEHNIDLSKIVGTGKQSRILKEDVLKYLELATISEKAFVHRFTDEIKDRTESIKGFQKAMVKTMTESLKIPHFVYSDEIKVTEISKLRQTLKANEDIKLSFMPFFIKAASNALKRYPILNATLDHNCENVTYKSEINIGIAMDTKVGLAVPVIKNVERLTIIEITEELNRLITSGRNGSFSTSDLAGGTFTISNIGIIGGTYTKPVIMPPQLAIIAIGALQRLPRFDEANNVIAEEIINISAAADHRIIDGATMARFIEIIKRQLSNPYLLFLNL